MKKLLLVTIFAALSGCEINTPGSIEQPQVHPVTDSSDIRTIRTLLNLNGLDTVTVRRVASIAKIGTRRVEFSLQLYNLGLDTFHVPAGFVVSAEKFTLSLRSNRLRSWPSEASQITNISGLDLSRNSISNWNTANMFPSLLELDVTSSQLTSLNLPMAQMPHLDFVMAGGNQLIDIPSTILGVTGLKVDVYANKICNPSSTVDAFLKRQDQQWRSSQICPASP